MPKTKNCGNLAGPVGGECTGDTKWSELLFIFYCSLTLFFPVSFSGFRGSGPAALPARRAPPFLHEMTIFSLRKVKSGGAGMS